MLNVEIMSIMLTVLMLSVITPNVVRLNVVAPSLLPLNGKVNLNLIKFFFAKILQEVKISQI
jgi:hypothetical protein